MRFLLLFSFVFLDVGGMEPLSRADAPAITQPQTPESPVTAASLDPQAQQILKHCAQFYQGLQSFETDIAISVFTKHDGGDSQTFPGEAAHIAVKGPSDFALISNSGPINISTFYDGKTCNYYYPRGNQFTHPESVLPYRNLDETASGFLTSEGGLDPSFVLASLFMHSPLYFLSNGFVTQSSYLGVEKIGNIACHRVRLCDRASPFFIDLWIVDGDAPLLLQSQTSGKKPSSFVLIDTTKFTNWSINKPISEDVFRFHPPADAKLVSQFH
jgi:hypothetical protein